MKRSILAVFPSVMFILIVLTVVYKHVDRRSASQSSEDKASHAIIAI